MSTVTPVLPPQTTDFPSPATPEEPPKKGHALLWLVLGGLSLLLAVGVATFVVLASGDDPAPLVNDHTAEAGEPVLLEVPGYAYTNPSPTDAADIDGIWTQVNEDFAATMPARFADTPLVTTWSAHEVSTADTEMLAVLGLMEINPQYLEMRYFDPDAFVPGMAGGMATEGTSVTTETIDGESVAVATDPDDFVTFAWYHEGTVSMVSAEDEDAVRTFAEAYITKQNS